MKKIYFWVVTLVLMVVFFTGCQNEKIYYVGTNAEFEPFEYLDNSNIVGFDMELIEEIAKLKNLKIKIKDMSFDGLLPALQSKKIDLVIAGMTATEERKKSVLFTESYYTANQVIIVRNNNSNIKNFENLKNKEIGVVLGFTGDIIATEIKNAKVERYNTSYSAILDLKSNKIDAVILDSEPAKNFVKNNEGIKIIKENSEKEDYAIAFRKEDKKLLGIFNSGLKEIKNNGTYDKLINKYFN